MLEAFVKSTSGPGLTGAACESTLPKIGSTTSFAWQHGHVTFRFSPSFSPMAVFYANFIFTPAGALRMWLAEEICRHAGVLPKLEKGPGSAEPFQQFNGRRFATTPLPVNHRV